MDYKQKTINSYNKNAKGLSLKFKDYMDLQKRYEFGRFIGLLKGKKILDLGCGSGDHSVYFKEKGLEVKAIDLSEEMVKLSKEKGVDANVMDIESLDFEDNSFDGIWAVTSLLHIPKSRLGKVIEKLSKILKEGGILYVSFKEGEGEEIIDKGLGDQRFFSFWQWEDLRKEFEERFELIENKRTEFKGTIFLQAFFRKRE